LAFLTDFRAMVLPVVMYGTPVLRQKGARIEEITPTVRQLISDMFETMYAYKGIGLAAQQVGVPLQLTVIDVRGVTDRPSSLELLAGSTLTPLDVGKFMPLVLVNPQLTPAGQPVTGPEGCLSFPEVYADISRSDAIDVTALGADGQRLSFRCGGLLARVVQHETDHLHGILFIDRMSREVKADLREDLERLQAATKVALSSERLVRG
jgi:peptide deformylase